MLQKNPSNAWALSWKYKLPLLFASVILPLVISFTKTYQSPSQREDPVEAEINDEKQKFNALHKMTWQTKSKKNIQKQPSGVLWKTCILFRKFHQKHLWPGNLPKLWTTLHKKWSFPLRIHFLCSATQRTMYLGPCQT